MPTNTLDDEKQRQRRESMESGVLIPQIIPDWGYGFYQHNFHREISIVYNKVDDDLTARMKDHALSGRNTDKDYRHLLAGQIAEEFETPFDNNLQLKEEFTEVLKSQVRHFLGTEPSEDFEWFTWTNISKPGEFNPVHCHTECLLSFVFYLDIPEVIRQEYKEPLTTVASKGLIKFYSSYNSDEITFNPRTGDLFLFTANHRHAVGAFYSEGVERISLAGNITKL
jgi:hypothetical protein